jgi:hypothetical protein
VPATVLRVHMPLVVERGIMMNLSHERRIKEILAGRAGKGTRIVGEFPKLIKWRFYGLLLF